MRKLILFLTCAILIYFCVLSILPMNDSDATVSRITSTQRFHGLSSDTKPTTGVIVSSTFYETNTGLIYIYNGSAWVVTGTYAVGDTTSLRSPGTSNAVYSRGYDVGGYMFTIALINTTVTMVLEGKVGNSNWTAIGVDSTRYTANGYYGLLSANIAFYDSTRLNFISEEGGANGFVNYNSSLGRGISP